MHRQAIISRCFVCLLALGMLPSQRGAAQALPENAREEAVAYLEPLRAQLSDESAFVDVLESMGDAEVVRLDALEDRLRRVKVTAEEGAAIQQEIRGRLAKLGWLCDAGIQYFSENSHVRNFRGNIYYDNLGRRTDAIKEWHTAVSLDSNYADPYNNLGMHYFHAGRYPLGFQNMDKALELEPDNPDFLFNMTQNYLIFGPEVEKKRGWTSKRVYKEAMKLSKRAVKNAPDDYQLLEDYAVNFLAADRFGVKADWKDAAKAWQAAREYAPNKVKVFYTWINEGRMWKSRGKKDDARQCFGQALKMMPDSEVT
ncbi:MAG: tetratricopeptide repeat protein, partial [Candidatus Hydrogenedentes bacterium]|nr:tetratricopeptide repeat protein [Candidatus Hydrogenedentota bacterium]